jgi:hypothetical protein
MGSIFRKLRLQRIHRIKFDLVAQSLHKLYAQGFLVQISFEIEQVNLDGWRSAVKGRPHPNIAHPNVGGLQRSSMHAGGIHPILGDAGACIPHGNVRRGKANGAPPLVALFYGACKRVPASQQSSSIVNSTLLRDLCANTR